MTALIALVIGYLVGSFPSAAVAARFRRQDIFAVGSSSMGAMNTARNLGWALGVLVLLLDLGKGALASGIGLWLGGFGDDPLAPLAAGVGAVIGHLWSVWVGFRGGKGLATTLGVTLPVYPLGGLYALVTLLVLIAVFRKVTPATFVTALFFPVGVFLSLPPTPERTAVTLSACLIALLVALKHLLPTRPIARTPRET